MRIKKISLRNFKGISSLEVNFTDRTDIFGDNATGKTSIYDSFLWLLFDKDSNNKSDFSVKPIGADKPEVEVSAIFDIDGKETELKKVLKEKWTKKRGSAFAEFSGHTVVYYIDGDKAKQKDYKAFIAEIISEDTFKLITNVRYFNEFLHWKKRREILLSISGEMTKEELKTALPKFAKFIDNLGDKPVEKYKERLLDIRKGINEELEQIPVRIDELSRCEVNADELNAAKENIAKIDIEIKDLQSKIKALKGGDFAEIELEKIKAKYHSKMAELEQAKAEVNTEQLKQINGIREKKQNEVQKYYQRKKRYENQIDELKREIKNAEQNEEWSKTKKAKNDARIEELRLEYAEVANKKFEYEAKDICPTCGQPLPREQVQAAREKAFAEWQAKKNKQLEDIINEANFAKNELADIERNSRIDIEVLKNKLPEYETELKKSINAMAKIAESEQKEIDELKNANKTIFDDLDKQIYELQQKMQAEIKIHSENSKSGDNKNAIAELEENIEQKREAKKEFENVLISFKAWEQNIARIEELKREQKELAIKFEETEKQLNEVDEFIKAKVELMQGALNKHFKLATFKLFEIQINGGLNQTCETLVDGVPYNDLNNAMKINVGLDIVNTLSQHYGKKAPIFIDNAEAVTSIKIGVASQLIRLVVSEKDTQLRVENK
jgi:DNA repair exonuclease SbcCD ATPase subunit